VCKASQLNEDQNIANVFLGLPEKLIYFLTAKEPTPSPPTRTASHWITQEIMGDPRSFLMSPAELVESRLQLGELLDVPVRDCSDEFFVSAP
jgi:hypothetical protein